MSSVVCATSMTSAINLVLNLVRIWLLFVVMADVRKIRDGRLGYPRHEVHSVQIAPPNSSSEALQVRGTRLRSD